MALASIFAVAILIGLCLAAITHRCDDPTCCPQPTGRRN